MVQQHMQTNSHSLSFAKQDYYYCRLVSHSLQSHETPLSLPTRLHYAAAQICDTTAVAERIQLLSQGTNV